MTDTLYYLEKVPVGLKKEHCLFPSLQSVTKDTGVFRVGESDPKRADFQMDSLLGHQRCLWIEVSVPLSRMQPHQRTTASTE